MSTLQLRHFKLPPHVLFDVQQLCFQHIALPPYSMLSQLREHCQAAQPHDDINRSSDVTEFTAAEGSGNQP